MHHNNINCHRKWGMHCFISLSYISNISNITYYNIINYCRKTRGIVFAHYFRVREPAEVTQHFIILHHNIKVVGMVFTQNSLVHIPYKCVILFHIFLPLYVCVLLLLLKMMVCSSNTSWLSQSRCNGAYMHLYFPDEWWKLPRSFYERHNWG